MAFTEAYKEAAVAPAGDEIVIETMEFYHTSWTGPERICTLRAGASLKLEASAPRNPSATVAFQGLQFRFTRPSKTRGAQTVEIAMPNISRRTAQLFKNAIKTGGAVEAIWRTYLASDTTAPQINPPPQFQIFNVTTTPFELRAEARFFDWLGKSSHKVYYTDETVPALLR